MASVSTLVVDCDWVCESVHYQVEQLGITTTLPTVAEYILYVLETHAWTEPKEWLRTVRLCTKMLFGDMERSEIEELYISAAGLLQEVMSCVEVVEIKEITHEGVTYTLTGRFLL